MSKTKNNDNNGTKTNQIFKFAISVEFKFEIYVLWATTSSSESLLINN